MNTKLFLSVLGCLVIGLGSFFLRAKPATCQRIAHNNVGAHRCKSCHENAYKTWKASAHAKAFERLTKEQKTNKTCLSCHTTGTEPHLQGVQCESCHGGGRFYVRKEIMIDPKLARSAGLKVTRGKKGCVMCHNSSSSKLKKFHFPHMWKKIKHN